MCGGGVGLKKNSHVRLYITFMGTGIAAAAAVMTTPGVEINKK